jgi:hemoglobin/transferrin/lactoferrin receptor protein
MSLALAERVELVKGASSVLYGTGALGGAVNVLLPQARFEPGLKLQTALGWESASKGLRGTGVLNLSEGDFALMLGAASQRLDDYKSPEGTVARTGYDAQSLIGQLRWRLDAAQQLRLSLQQHVDEDAWYPGSTRSLPNAALGTSTVHSPEQRRNLVELGYSRRGGRDAPNLDVRLWRQSVQRQIWSYANQLKREIAQTTVSFDTTGVDLKADWLLHPEHLVSAGVNLWRMEASPERYIASPTPPSALVRNDPFADAGIRAAGLFVQDDMRFGALGVLAGLRWDRVAGEAASMSNGAVTNGLDRSDSALSGSVGPELGGDVAAAALCQPGARLPCRRDARALRGLAARRRLTTTWATRRSSRKPRCSSSWASRAPMPSGTTARHCTSSASATTSPARPPGPRWAGCR